MIYNVITSLLMMSFNVDKKRNNRLAFLVIHLIKVVYLLEQNTNHHHYLH